MPSKSETWMQDNGHRPDSVQLGPAIAHPLDASRGRHELHPRVGLRRAKPSRSPLAQ